MPTTSKKTKAEMTREELFLALQEMMADKEFKKFIKDVVNDESTDSYFEQELKKNRDNKLQRGKKLVVDDRGGISAEEKLAQKITKASSNLHNTTSNRPSREMIFKQCTSCGNRDYMAKGGVNDRDPYRCSRCLAGG